MHVACHPKRRPRLLGRPGFPRPWSIANLSSYTTLADSRSPTSISPFRGHYGPTDAGKYLRPPKKKGPEGVNLEGLQGSLQAPRSYRVDNVTLVRKSHNRERSALCRITESGRAGDDCPSASGCLGCLQCLGRPRHEIYPAVPCRHQPSPTAHRVALLRPRMEMSRHCDTNRRCKRPSRWLVDEHAFDELVQTFARLLPDLSNEVPEHIL
jgi:hypothetical protein